MSTISNVLLIDDDRSINFLHRITLEDTKCVENVIVCDSGEEALFYLKDTPVIPDVIFLDINMPGMNGWEFLKQYSLLDKQIIDNIILFVLSTSMNPTDQEKANKNEFVTCFLNKALTEELIIEIADEYFSK